MGKTTLYHPVSLHVIRGSLDYGGFQLGRIRQIFASPETGEAVYAAEVVVCPKGFTAKTPQQQIKLLNSYFASDIRVVNIATRYSGKRKSGKLIVTIETFLRPAVDLRAPGEAQPLLVVEAEPVGAFQDLNWLVDDGFGTIENDAYMADQRTQRFEYDIPF